MNNIIQALKDNENPFGLMSVEMRAKAEEMKDLQIWQVYYDSGWNNTSIIDCHNSETYRLRPDYEEPEVEKCEIKVREGDLCWFNDSTNTWWALEQAIHFPDFIGFLYEDKEIFSTARAYKSTDGVIRLYPSTPQDEVLTPTHVLRKGK